MATLEYGEASLDTQLTTTAAVDEWWDHHVNRPLAALLVRGLAPTRVSANQITLLSGITSVSAAVCLALAQRNTLVLGGVLLLVTLVLDCADGQLARVRGAGTFVGRLMDGYVDIVGAIGLHVGLWIYFATAGFSLFGREVTGLIPTFLAAAAVGGTMAIHSMIYDSHKNRYKRDTGQGTSEAHTPEFIMERFRTSTSLAERACMPLYWCYSKLQSGVAGQNEEGGKHVPPALAALRHRYLGHGMQLLGPLGPTLRLTVLAFSMILAGYVSWGIYVYFVFAFVLTNVYALVVHRIIRRLEAKLAAEEAALA